jgi:cytoskeletal protein CcmA (bactofilin family)
MVGGEVSVEDRLGIHSKGKLYGTVATPVLVVEEGGIFEGNCKMGPKSTNTKDLEGAEKPLT